MLEARDLGGWRRVEARPAVEGREPELRKATPAVEGAPPFVCRIVVLGAGYGGITCALRLARWVRRRRGEGAVELILVDRNPYHLLETRLHEAAARGVEVTIPIAGLIRDRGIRFVAGEVEELDLAAKRVRVVGGELEYDVLVVALGSKTAYYGIPGLEEHAFALKTLEDAQSLKANVERRLAEALGEADVARRRWLRRVVIGGGGLTGVELAMELAERIEELTGRRLGEEEGGEVVVLEAGERLLPGSDRKIGERAAKLLRERRVQVVTGVRVEGVGPDEVRLSTGEVLRAGTIVWTGGVQVADLLRRSGAETGRQGRVLVEETLEVKGFPGVYAIGDAALAVNPRTGEPVPMAAQFALQQGRLAAENIIARLEGRPARAYQPRVLGEVVSLGRHLAVGWLALGWFGRLRFAGFLMSLLKRAIAEKHLLLLWKERKAWELRW